MQTRKLSDKLIIGFFILLLFALSGIRENTFESINAFIKGQPYGLEFILNTHSIVFWSKFKWVLIMFSFMVFMSITSLLIHKIYKNKLYTKLTMYAFIVLFSVSAIFILFGLAMNNFKFGYTLARQLMDFTQTPVLFLLLFASFKVFDKQ